MIRRLLGAALLTVLVTAGASSAATERPRAGCTRGLTDVEGDGKYSLSSGVNDPRNTSTDAIDITNVTMRYTGTAFEVHLKAKSMTAAFGAHETAYRWDVTFENANGAKMSVAAMRTNGVYDTVSTTKAPNADSYPNGKFTIGTATTGFTGTTANVDTATGWVVWTIPAEEFAKAFTGPVDGAQLTKVAAQSYAYIPGVGTATTREADAATSTDPAQSTYTVGDDYCFGPPPAVLTSTLNAPKVAFGDSIPLTATLKSDAGTALAGKQVQFAVTGEPVKTGTTNAAGLATVSFTPAKGAGTYPLTITFAGDATDGKAKLTGINVTVLVETTKLAAIKATSTSATARTVTTTLTDNDAKPVTGKVEWWANGKKVATTSTDGKGKATYKGAKAGQTIVAKYAGIAGKYAPSASKPLKLA